jgi:hypothetical protein
MLKIPAKSRYLNLQGSIKMYYVLVIGAFISILSFLLYKDFIVAAVMVGCTIASYLLLSKAPKDEVIELNDDYLIIDDIDIEWSKCLGWAMVDLGDTIEFVVQTSNMNHQFYYFYLKETQPGIKDLIMQLTQYLNYDASIPQKNPIHAMLRKWGLK